MHRARSDSGFNQCCIRLKRATSDAKQDLDAMLPHANNRYTRATLEQLAAQAAVEETKRIVAEHGELVLRVTCRRKRADPFDALSYRLSQEPSKLAQVHGSQWQSTRPAEWRGAALER